MLGFFYIYTFLAVVNLYISSEMYVHSDYRQIGYHVCPEISRVILLHLFRAHKVLC